MKTFIKVLVTVYLIPGVFLALDHHSRESNTFVCDSPESPHGYITIMNERGGNPDPEKCVSRLEKESPYKTMLTLLFLGTPLVMMKATR